MGTAQVVTFGCRLNAYESQLMRALADAAGVEDTVYVNTCAVTAEAERQARQAIRRARRDRPTARIVVTGCAAQIDPSSYAAMAEVDQVWGNTIKLRPDAYGAPATARVVVEDLATVEETAGHLLAGFGDRSRAFVQAQQGCDHRCTFCIIPFGRGPSRSVPMGKLVREVRTLVEAGYREVVLTGVDLTAYGHDLPGRPRFGQMVRRLLATVPELPRLRLSSLDAVEVDEALLRALAEEPRLMPHLHLSLQSGDDLILKRMKRRHDRAAAIAFCERVRAARPDTVFGADLIAGFPTETEAMFANTLALIEDCDLTWLHVFPYSARPGTPAARMPQVPKPVRKERAARLRAAGAVARARFLDRAVGTNAAVLLERDRRGLTEHYAPVRLDRDAPPGTVLPVRITAVRDDELRGTVAA